MDRRGRGAGGLGSRGAGNQGGARGVGGLEGGLEGGLGDEARAGGSREGQGPDGAPSLSRLQPCRQILDYPEQTAIDKHTSLL